MNEMNFFRQKVLNFVTRVAALQHFACIVTINFVTHPGLIEPTMQMLECHQRFGFHNKADTKCSHHCSLATQQLKKKLHQYNRKQKKIADIAMTLKRQ